MPQLICKDLALGYEGRTVVSGLSFTVSAGNYLCIVGDNGSGKTTLMKALLGLRTVMSGEINTGEGLLASEIGYLPQQTAAQKDFPASVREVVRSGLLNRCGMRPFYTFEEKKLADYNMKRLGITNLAGHCYRELSGGQQQRTLLARALCATRKILLLDEPAVGLDPKASADMYDIIYTLNKSGITIIMISHDIEASVKYASHILHIGMTAPLFFGSKEDYLQSSAGRMYTGFTEGA